MRVLLFTGKGGVGKTTTAAATAVHAARSGRKTLVLSTDAAHSLGDALDVELGDAPVEVEPGLEALQVDAQRAFERSWRDLQDYLVVVLDRAGVDPLRAEELTVLPGAEEVLALLALRDAVRSGRYDLVVVDCAPTAETLRLLALPEALSWYVDKVFPAQRRALRVARPLLGRVTQGVLPQERVLDAAERLHSELLEVQDVLRAPGTSVRLVLTPERVVLAEARRTLTSLALYGYRVDGVVANRVVPRGGGPVDPWRAGWADAQEALLAQARADLAPIAVREVAYLAAEPVGVAALAGYAEDLYATDDPAADGPGGALLAVERTVDGFRLGLALPLARREQLDLVRSGDDLVVSVGSHRRRVTLPSALRRCRVTGAVLRDGRLLIDLEPDPALWRDDFS